MRFEFSTAGRIVFGAGSVNDVGALARPLGRRALVVTGRSADRADRIARLLGGEGIDAEIFHVAGEPDVPAIARGVAAAREHRRDLVVGIGGGSAIDAAKAIAALATNDGGVTDYLEVIGRAEPLARVPLPCVAIPTTAGTGAEVTRNAVIGSPEHHVKVSLRGPTLLPAVAIVDPDLTIDLPPDVTARTGLDALTQLVEPYVSSRANPITDAFALDGLRLVSRALRAVVHDGHNAAARQDMARASLFGGLCLANAGLGAVHGFAGPIGGMFAAPHGAVCAALLPHVVAGNIRAIEARAPNHPGLGRYDDVARVLTGRPSASRADAVDWIAALVRDLEIPPLRAYGVAPTDVAAVVEKAARASSMKANPIALTAGELAEMLAAAM